MFAEIGSFGFGTAAIALFGAFIFVVWFLKKNGERIASTLIR